ncbi:MAG: cyclophane-forming radical SAM/SPASM peptide maturase GrrM/OscB [Cyanobacteriota bacterium]|nr:cyclophane-forming radical SAM/SPASM peptide maturase GrrM/OscB [Cyanobacteriota bacterium]
MSPSPGAGFGPLNLLVVQGTPFCNLDCDYCYLPDRGDRTRLSGAVLDAALDRVLESPYVGVPFTLLWHAGEPLALPRSFYDDATERIEAAIARHPERAGLRIQQCVQTNATTINREWCDCLKRNTIAVGVSLDGPAFLHDAHRRTRTGLGSHAATMRGIGWLQRERIPFHVIAVLTSDSLDHPDAIFDFFLEQGITDVGFNMEETEGANRLSSLDQPGLEDRWRAFLERFWDLCASHPGALRVREFETLCGQVVGNSRMDHTDMNRPYVILSVDVEGRFSTFDPELLGVRTERYGDFVLGQVGRDSLAAVLATPAFARIAADMAAGVEECRRSCDHFALCGGGAGSNKYWEKGTLATSETQACRWRVKVMADVVLSGLERSLGLGEVRGPSVLPSRG